MNFEKIMEALVKTRDNSFTSGAEKIQTAKKVAGALQSYFTPPGLNGMYKAKMQAAAYEGSLGVSSDIAEVNKFSYNLIMEKAEYDNLWEQAFQKVPLLGSQNSWEIHTGKSGIALVMVKEGEKLKVNSVSSTSVDAHVNKHGEAIGITDEMIRFRLIAKLMDLVGEARDKYLIGKSNIFYALLQAAADANVTTYQGSGGDGELRRDTLTWNQGLKTLGDRMKLIDPNASQAPVILYANVNDEDRIEAIVRARTADQAAALGSAREVMKRPVRRLYTYNCTEGLPFFVWPGRKNQWAEAMPLTQFTDTDILALLYIQAYWTYLGGICADNGQFQTITLG